MSDVGRWEVALRGAERGSGGAAAEPAFLRIARAIADDIRRGRLKAGDAMPGSRVAATSVGVHRNTVLAAYRECIAEGWLVTEPARGTFVSPALPDTEAVRPRARRDATAYDLPPLVPLELPDAPMTLGGGVPDVRLFPAEALARAMRRAMRRRPLEVLSYGDPAGPTALRRAIAAMVAATRGVPARVENVLVVRGSQMGLDLVARTLLRAGDRVAIESFGYRPAWEALAASGARLVPTRIDERGLDVDALGDGLRAVYVTPHHQFPTTVTLDAARRLRLLELAREQRFFILEDDYDHEFHYVGRPVLPLASSDRHGSVIYVGTFSKVLAPGLRLGFVVAPAPVIERLTRTRRFVDRQGDHTLCTALAELIEDGEVQRHIRRARRIYGERRERNAELLRRTLGSAIDFELPSGGTAIWARVDPALDVDAWAVRALERGLLLQPARLFSSDGESHPFLRLGFAQHDDAEAREAVKRLAASRPRSGGDALSRERPRSPRSRSSRGS
ncbi:MAG: PLP-dependent aminotransferase family protein [Labilithrix sp.]